nr:MAG: ORF1 [TTV-like mini virus]
MPFYWRRRRPRRFWRWRTRRFIRRRFPRWRRRWRQRRVRKRKLKKLTLKEWQPTTIRKLVIKGTIPLYETTSERIGHNMTQWLESTAPEHYPGGGSFSLHVFTLNGLYEMHKQARNWWTTSNCNLPLIRYLGCSFDLFRSTNSDYITVYTTCGDLKANLDLYQSTQPSILQLNRKKKILICNEHAPHKKPYKRIHIKPPPLWTNKWFFQKHISKIPLLLLITSAASFGRYYLSSKAISNTMGFTSLNTDTFQLHNFKRPPGTTGYRPNTTHMLFALARGIQLKDAQYKHLIYLGETRDMTPGIPVENKPSTPTTGTWQNWVDKYYSTPTYWGNPFYPTYLSDDLQQIIITNLTLDQIKNNTISDGKGDKKLGSDFTTKDIENLWHCRYNPQADHSNNAIFLAQIDDDDHPWHIPNEARLVCKGLPLWLLLNGFLDYHSKTVDVQRLMTDWVLIIVSDAITPKKDYYLPLDPWFINGRSPYHPEDTPPTIYDKLNWHPKCNFQVSTISKICATGPATVKLPDNVSTEAHANYRFYFKVGGCPPPMDDVCDPNTEPDYPTPSNFLQKPLLQDPETPIQYYLQSFDQRRGFITKTAAKRLKTDKESKELLFKSAGKSSLDFPSPQTSDEETSETEEDPQALQLQLEQQLKRQRKLHNRILKLLETTQSL